MDRGIYRWGAILAGLLIAGCATGSDNLYGGLHKQGVTGNEVSVIVSNVWNEMDGLKLADAHCKKFGKAARLNRFADYKGSYDCVAP